MNGQHLGALVESLASAGKKVMEKRLTWGTSGNFSVRIDAERFLISASGTPLDRLDEATTVVCSVNDGTYVGSRSPSVETELHRRIYWLQPNAGSILHTSAPLTTLLACARIDIPCNISTDTLHYVERVVRVPYQLPGSIDLAEAAGVASREGQVLLLNNHGSLVYAGSPQDALMKAEALEFLAHMLIAARQARIELREFTTDEVEAFHYRAGGGRS